MSGVKLPDSRQVPLLDTHDRSSVKTVLGSTRELRIENGQLVGRNVFSKNTAANEAFELIREGHLRDNSIGYKVLDSERIPAGKSKVIQGRRFEASKDYNLRITTAWEVSENSVCAIGADQLAKVRAATDPTKNNLNFLKEFRTMKFKEWLKKRGLELDNLTQEQAEALRNDYDAEMQRTAADPGRTEPDLDTARAAGRAEELERQRQIKRLGGDQIPKEMITRAIDENWTIETTKEKFLETLRASMSVGTGSPAIHCRDKVIEAKHLEAAFLLRENFDDIAVKKYDEQTLDRADQIRGMPVYDLCKEAIRLDGLTIPENKNELITRAFTTSSLPYILGNVANKAALSGYQLAETTYQFWCNIGSCQDFKAHTRVRLSDIGDLEAVNNAGEIASGKMQESYEQLTPETYGSIIGITRKNIINDDAQVFTKLPGQMGALAAAKINELVYDHLISNGNLTDSVALFHATHVNLNTSSALTATTLAAAIAALRKQKNASGKPLNFSPAFLLAAPELENTARGLLESDMLMATDGTTSTKHHPTKNIFMGMATPVIDAWLTLHASATSTTWYLTAAPSKADTIEVAFLNGKQTPTVEQREAPANMLGIFYRVYIDAGVKALDFRGMQKNTA